MILQVVLYNFFEWKIITHLKILKGITIQNVYVGVILQLTVTLKILI